MGCLASQSRESDSFVASNKKTGKFGDVSYLGVTTLLLMMYAFLLRRREHTLPRVIGRCFHLFGYCSEYLLIAFRRFSFCWHARTHVSLDVGLFVGVILE